MKSKKHILVVSQYFYPETFRINDICQEWVKRGHKVTVVTGIPNYPTGRFFEGYGIHKKRHELWNNIEICRIPLVPRGAGSLGLIANYMSFVVAGFFWQLKTKINVDVVFTFEVSPMTQALIGVWYSKKKKIPHYLYVQDLWPENVEYITGIHSKLLLSPIERMVRYIYKNSNHIFATSNSFKIEIQKKCTEKQKVTFLAQYAEEFYTPQKKDKLEDVQDDESLKIVFTGNIGYAQGLEILPKFAKALKKGGKKVSFYIIGDGRYKEKLINKIRCEGVTSMFYLLGRKEPREIASYMSHFDIAFLSFADDDLFSMTIPAKLQSYMACGMPILAIAKGETKSIIEEAKCGYCCETYDETALMNFITDVIDDKTKLHIMRDNSLDYYNRNYTKEIFFKKMNKYIEEKECYLKY